jgi:capsular exopolysaccharide synthesis family protein
MRFSLLKKRARRAQQDTKTYDDLTKYLTTVSAPDSAGSEAYRTLRTNLLYSFTDNPPKSILLTSPGPGEGKSLTCANLGVVLAQADKRTFIVDCDFRRPAIHKLFGLKPTWGIADVLVGESSLQEVWTEPTPGLKVASVGYIPPNPAELLSSRHFSEFLASVRQEFDYVLLDAAPLAAVSDAAIVAVQADGVLFVVDAQKTRKQAVQRGIRSLEAVGANVLGTVMNRVKATEQDYLHYDYTTR